MKIAVVGHTRRDSPEADFDALAGGVSAACAQGARVVVLPSLTRLTQAAGGAEAGAARDITRRLQDTCPDVEVLGAPLAAADALAHMESPLAVSLRATRLGNTAVLEGDDCLDSALARDVASMMPDAVILRPGGESDLQTEAMIERAIALCESVAGLVIVAECDGAPAGEPGHGGSVIVVSGEIVAESVGGDDVLLAEVSLPVPPPEPRDPLPELPPILAQRFARHRGERPSVSYPADLS